MKALLLDLATGFLNHRPATAFISASLALNLAVAIYRPLLQSIVGVLFTKFVSPAVASTQGANLTVVERLTLDFYTGRLHAGINRMGERSIREAQGYALVVAILCFFILYFDVSGGPVVFLPTVPVWFAIAVYYYARKRCKKYEQDVSTILKFCKVSKAVIDKQIKGSIATAEPFEGTTPKDKTEPREKSED